MASAYFEHGLASQNTTIKEITDEAVEEGPISSKRGAIEYAITPVTDVVPYGIIQEHHPAPAVSHLKLITPVQDVLRHAFVEEQKLSNAVSHLELGDDTKCHDMQLNGFHKCTLDTSNSNDFADSVDDASERYDTPVGFTTYHNPSSFRSFKEMNMMVPGYTTDHKETEMLNNQERAIVKYNEKPIFNTTGRMVFEDSNPDASFVKSNHDCQVSLSSASDASASVGFHEKNTCSDDLHDSLDREAELTFDDFLSYCEKEWKTFYSKMNKDTHDEWHEFCSLVDREGNMAVREGDAGCSSHSQEDSRGNERTVLEDAPSDDLCLKQFQGLSLMETYIQVKRMCGLVRERLDVENKQHPDVSFLAHDYIVTLLDGYKPYQSGVGNLETLLLQENGKPDLTEIMDTMWFGDRSRC